MRSKSAQKQLIDNVFKFLIFTVASVSVMALIIMFGYIINESIPAYKHYGLFHMYFTSDFTEQGGFGIWGALTITLTTSLLAVIIAVPLSLRTAIFLKYRIKQYKGMNIFINIATGIPSVLFGIFAIKSLSSISSIFGMGTYSIFNSILMLSMMVFPTLISLFRNQLSLVDGKIIKGALALGNSKTSAIYRVVKREIRPQIVVSSIIALGRAIGETMALSMLMTSPSSTNLLKHGLGGFLNSPFASLGVEISKQMFTDGANPNTRSALFAAGIAIFVITMILIGIVTKISSKRKFISKNPFDFKSIRTHRNKYKGYYRITKHIILFPFILIIYSINFIFHKISRGFDYILGQSHSIFEKKILKKDINIENYKFSIAKSKRKINIGDVTRLTLEYLSVIIVIGSIAWIIISTLVYGLPEWKIKDLAFQYTNNHGQIVGGDIMNPLIWTLLLIMISIIIATPLALITALYLSEYARYKKSGKIIKFFLDSLGGTPSILFGIFGAVFFLRQLGLSKVSGGTSLIAGSLTIILVILPSFTRSIEQVIVKVPRDVVNASYALGVSKIETIIKIVLPKSIKGITTGIILSSGRIIAETAPIYLTLGMFAGVNLGFMEAGHTLTTDILYNQVHAQGNAEALLRNSYKLASASIILIGIISLFLEVVNLKKKEGKNNGRKFIQNKRSKSVISK